MPRSLDEYPDALPGQLMFPDEAEMAAAADRGEVWAIHALGADAVVGGEEG